MKTREYSSTVMTMIALMVGIFVLSLPATAQTTPAKTPTPAPTTTTADASKVAKSGLPAAGEYKISREDSITITCLNDPQYTVTAVVLPDGTISYPKMGQIVVVGMTPHQLENKIRAFLKHDFVKPQVSVSVPVRQIRQVSIVGTGIKETGKRVMRDGWKVLDAIADAGGLLSDRTELFTGSLIRSETGETVPLDLPKVLSNDPQANMLLEPGDLLLINAVEESKSQVQVSGEVNKPGFILIPRDGSIGKALEAAGGPKETAQLSQVVIERNGEKIPLDLRRMVQDGTEPEGVKLQPGDKLVIPENKRLFYVVGAVSRQGAISLPDDRPMTLVRALSDSGVQLPAAETKKTVLTRLKPDGSQDTKIIDVETLLAKSDYSKDIVLQPGDMIYVPFKKGHKFQATDVLGYLNVLPGVRYLFDGFRY